MKKMWSLYAVEYCPASFSCYMIFEVCLGLRMPQLSIPDSRPLCFSYVSIGSLSLVVASLLFALKRGVFKPLGRKKYHFLLIFKFENKLILSCNDMTLSLRHPFLSLQYQLERKFLTTSYATRHPRILRFSSLKTKAKQYVYNQNDRLQQAGLMSVLHIKWHIEKHIISFIAVKVPISQFQS